MPMILVGVPAGFDSDREALEALVRAGTIEKFEVAQQAIVLYLRRLQPGREFTARLPLVARLAGQVQMPAPVLYEYYQPERRSAGLPLRVTAVR